MMTFEEFKATKTECEDLGSALSDTMLQGSTGLMYLGALYIEHDTRPDHSYILTIGREQTPSNDLDALERDLFAWAMSEGYGE
jgi:hypothetical protein